MVIKFQRSKDWRQNFPFFGTISIVTYFYMVKSVMSNKSVRLIGHLHMGDNFIWLSVFYGLFTMEEPHFQKRKYFSCIKKSLIFYMYICYWKYCYNNVSMCFISMVNNCFIQTFQSQGLLFFINVLFYNLWRPCNKDNDFSYNFIQQIPIIRGEQFNIFLGLRIHSWLTDHYKYIW